ncbi:unnamed protein product, partial [Chrysoparadoxa australica]
MQPASAPANPGKNGQAQGPQMGVPMPGGGDGIGAGVQPNPGMVQGQGAIPGGGMPQLGQWMGGVGGVAGQQPQNLVAMHQQQRDLFQQQQQQQIKRQGSGLSDAMSQGQQSAGQPRGQSLPQVPLQSMQQLQQQQQQHSALPQQGPMGQQAGQMQMPQNGPLAQATQQALQQAGVIPLRPGQAGGQQPMSMMSMAAVAAGMESMGGHNAAYSRRILQHLQWQLCNAAAARGHKLTQQQVQQLMQQMLQRARMAWMQRLLQQQGGQSGQAQVQGAAGLPVAGQQQAGVAGMAQQGAAAGMGNMQAVRGGHPGFQQQQQQQIHGNTGYSQQSFQPQYLSGEGGNVPAGMMPMGGMMGQQAQQQAQQQQQMQAHMMGVQPNQLGVNNPQMCVMPMKSGQMPNAMGRLQGMQQMGAMNDQAMLQRAQQQQQQQQQQRQRVQQQNQLAMYQNQQLLKQQVQGGSAAGNTTTSAAGAKANANALAFTASLRQQPQPGSAPADAASNSNAADFPEQPDAADAGDAMSPPVNLDDLGDVGDDAIPNFASAEDLESEALALNPLDMFGDLGIPDPPKLEETPARAPSLAPEPMPAPTPAKGRKKGKDKGKGKGRGKRKQPEAVAASGDADEDEYRPGEKKKKAPRRSSSGRHIRAPNRDVPGSFAEEADSPDEQTARAGSSPSAAAAAEVEAQGDKAQVQGQGVAGGGTGTGLVKPEQGGQGSAAVFTPSGGGAAAAGGASSSLGQLQPGVAIGMQMGMDGRGFVQVQQPQSMNQKGMPLAVPVGMQPHPIMGMQRVQMPQRGVAGAMGHGNLQVVMAAQAAAAKGQGRQQGMPGAKECSAQLQLQQQMQSQQQRMMQQQRIMQRPAAAAAALNSSLISLVNSSMPPIGQAAEVTQLSAKLLVEPWTPHKVSSEAGAEKTRLVTTSCHMPFVSVGGEDAAADEQFQKAVLEPAIVVIDNLLGKVNIAAELFSSKALVRGHGQEEVEVTEQPNDVEGCWDCWAAKHPQSLRGFVHCAAQLGNLLERGAPGEVEVDRTPSSPTLRDNAKEKAGGSNDQLAAERVDRGGSGASDSGMPGSPAHMDDSVGSEEGGEADEKEAPTPKNGEDNSLENGLQHKSKGRAAKAGSESEAEAEAEVNGRGGAGLGAKVDGTVVAPSNEQELAPIAYKLMPGNGNSNSKQAEETKQAGLEGELSEAVAAGADDDASREEQSAAQLAVKESCKVICVWPGAYIRHFQLANKVFSVTAAHHEALKPVLAAAVEAAKEEIEPELCSVMAYGGLSYLRLLLPYPEGLKRPFVLLLGPFENDAAAQEARKACEGHEEAVCLSLPTGLALPHLGEDKWTCDRFRRGVELRRQDEAKGGDAWWEMPGKMLGVGAGEAGSAQVGQTEAEKAGTSGDEGAPGVKSAKVEPGVGEKQMDLKDEGEQTLGRSPDDAQEMDVKLGEELQQGNGDSLLGDALEDDQFDPMPLPDQLPVIFGLDPLPLPRWVERPGDWLTSQQRSTPPPQGEPLGDGSNATVSDEPEPPHSAASDLAPAVAPGSGSTPKKFCGTVKAALSVDIGAWQVQMGELEAKIPAWLWCQGQFDFLKNMNRQIPGINGPQLSIFSPGSWLGGSEGPCRLRRVFCCHGPGAIEWAAVGGEHVSRMRELVRAEFGVDIFISEEKYFPDVAWLRERGLPVQCGFQLPGDVVVAKGSTLTWARSLGFSVCTSWCIGLMKAEQIASACERYLINKCLKPAPPNPVPLKLLALELARYVLRESSQSTAQQLPESTTMTHTSPVESLSLSLLQTLLTLLERGVKEEHAVTQWFAKAGMQPTAGTGGAHCEVESCQSELFCCYMQCADCLRENAQRTLPPSGMALRKDRMRPEFLCHQCMMKHKASEYGQNHTFLPKVRLGVTPQQLQSTTDAFRTTIQRLGSQTNQTPSPTYLFAFRGSEREDQERKARIAQGAWVASQEMETAGEGQQLQEVALSWAGRGAEGCRILQNVIEHLLVLREVQGQPLRQLVEQAGKALGRGHDIFVVMQQSLAAAAASSSNSSSAPGTGAGGGAGSGASTGAPTNMSQQAGGYMGQAGGNTGQGAAPTGM